MQKLLTGFVAASALALFASSGLACEFHSAQASVPAQEVVAMSTANDAATSAAATDAQSAATECAAGQTNCAPANK
jgi:hypothetical protein